MEAYTKLVVAVALVLSFAMGFEPMVANGQTICGMNIDGLKECQPSASKLSPVPPSLACCSAISNSDMQCFCNYKGSMLLSAYGIDFDQAMTLPAKCNPAHNFHC
ncbi:LTP_2 domain-containing protein [Cephalotus follicularis]|uniref:LTP_2 domain-containing protein n=1 Tax=Cephalotus follicularis TaxID=3775 RepID=A0A1Q3BGP3_CEPFO|nr:LTP_2 domain-containing protein [Cephalotus follicularis]